jgi:hypothetical protein
MHARAHAPLYVFSAGSVYVNGEIATAKSIDAADVSTRFNRFVTETSATVGSHEIDANSIKINGRRGNGKAVQTYTHAQGPDPRR